VERGDVGLDRGGYGPPRRRRLGDRRAYRPGRGAGGTGARGTNAVSGQEDDEYYGQLLRRPGDRPAYPREPGRPGPRQPVRFAPPADGYPPADQPPNSSPRTGGYASGGPGTDGAPNGGRVSGGGYGGPMNAGPAPGRQYRATNGRRVPPAADRLYRPPVPGSAGGTQRRHGAGQDPPGGMWRRPVRPSPAAGAPPGPDGRPVGAAQSVASIAPDGLESFARDLRALRAKAELDYPELAEVSHYTMKTLASAAGGLRLPTLPVAAAYVRACGGNVAEWEDRWQKLAAKITAGGGKKRRSDDGDQHAPAEPADAPAIAEPPGRPAAQDPDPGPGEVYVITSAKPRSPGWPGELRERDPGGPRGLGSPGDPGGRAPQVCGDTAQWAACCRPTTTCTASGRGTRRPRRP